MSIIRKISNFLGITSDEKSLNLRVRKLSLELRSDFEEFRKKEKQKNKRRKMKKKFEEFILLEKMKKQNQYTF